MDELAELPSKELIEKLNRLIKHNKNSFTDKDRVIFTKINTLDDKKRTYEVQLDEIDSGKQRIFNCFGFIIRQSGSKDQRDLGWVLRKIQGSFC
jgi:hypothetical protein